MSVPSRESVKRTYKTFTCLVKSSAAEDASRYKLVKIIEFFIVDLVERSFRKMPQISWRR
jgi:hypothetical protein